MRRLLAALCLLLPATAFAQLWSKPAAPVSFNPAAFGANSTPAPDSYWHVSEGSGSTLTNIGKDAGSYDLTITGADWITDSSTPALDFVSANSDLAASSTTVGITGYPFTIAAWVQATSSGQAGTIAAVGDASDNGSTFYGPRITSGADRVNVSLSDTSTGIVSALAAPSGDSIITAEYHLVVAVFLNATSRSIYVKDTSGNEANGTDSTSVVYEAGTDIFHIGHRPGDAGDYLNMRLIGAAVWKNTALSQAQVFTDLWNSGSWPPFVTAASSGSASPLKGPFGGPIS